MSDDFVFFPLEEDNESFEILLDFLGGSIKTLKTSYEITLDQICQATSLMQKHLLAKC